MECSHFAVGSLPDPVSEDDTPDPWDNGPDEAALEDSEDEGGDVEFLSDEGVDDCAKSREYDVEDEEHKSEGWVNLHDGLFAHTSSFVSFSCHFLVFVFVFICDNIKYVEALNLIYTN